LNNYLPISLQDTLDLFFKDEILKDFKCESCKDIGEVVIKRKFSKLPRVLILHLKRYQFQLKNENFKKSNINQHQENKTNFKFYKNDSTVKIPKFLTLKYLLDETAIINIPNDLNSRLKCQEFMINLTDQNTEKNNSNIDAEKFLKNGRYFSKQLFKNFLI
jgi:uncharacterized UBP type Zn finger protein